MERFIKGGILIIPFPFLDLSESKRRPAFLITELESNDVLLRQITSKAGKDKYLIKLEASDFHEGGLPLEYKTKQDFLLLIKVLLYNEQGQ